MKQLHTVMCHRVSNRNHYSIIIDCGTALGAEQFKYNTIQIQNYIQSHLQSRMPTAMHVHESYHNKSINQVENISHAIIAEYMCFNCAS